MLQIQMNTLVYCSLIAFPVFPRGIHILEFGVYFFYWCVYILSHIYAITYISVITYIQHHFAYSKTALKCYTIYPYAICFYPTLYMWAYGMIENWALSPCYIVFHYIIIFQCIYPSLWWWKCGFFQVFYCYK